MVAILEIGALISSLAVGKIGDQIGRRKTIRYGSAIFFVGGALQTFATNMPMMMLGRIIAGLGVGSLSTIVPVYQSEISPPHNRGKLACIEFSGNIIGYTTSVWVDYFCGFIEGNYSWRLPLLMQCVMGALLGVGSYLIVESPRYVQNGPCRERIIADSPPDGCLITTTTKRALLSLRTCMALVISTTPRPVTSIARSR
jgi:MFS family permease